MSRVIVWIEFEYLIGENESRENDPSVGVEV